MQSWYSGGFAEQISVFHSIPVSGPWTKNQKKYCQQLTAGRRCGQQQAKHAQGGFGVQGSLGCAAAALRLLVVVQFLPGGGEGRQRLAVWGMACCYYWDTPDLHLHARQCTYIHAELTAGWDC